MINILYEFLKTHINQSLISTQSAIFNTPGLPFSFILAYIATVSLTFCKYSIFKYMHMYSYFSVYTYKIPKNASISGLERKTHTHIYVHIHNLCLTEWGTPELHRVVIGLERWLTAESYLYLLERENWFPPME